MLFHTRYHKFSGLVSNEVSASFHLDCPLESYWHAFIFFYFFRNYGHKNNIFSSFWNILLINVIIVKLQEPNKTKSSEMIKENYMIFALTSEAR